MPPISKCLLVQRYALEDAAHVRITFDKTRSRLVRASSEGRGQKGRKSSRDKSIRRD
jgi:hypothetical protein